MSSSKRGAGNAEAETPAGAAELRPRSQPRLLPIGHGNLLMASRVVAIVTPQSSPMKRLRDDAQQRGKLVDATQGRRTRSIVLTDTDHVVLSAMNPETLAARLFPADGRSES